jgi:hypothetical protein
VLQPPEECLLDSWKTNEAYDVDDFSWNMFEAVSLMSTKFLLLKMNFSAAVL